MDADIFKILSAAEAAVEEESRRSVSQFLRERRAVRSQAAARRERNEIKKIITVDQLETALREAIDALLECRRRYKVSGKPSELTDFFDLSSMPTISMDGSEFRTMTLVAWPEHTALMGAVYEISQLIVDHCNHSALDGIFERVCGPDELGRERMKLIPESLGNGWDAWAKKEAV